MTINDEKDILQTANRQYQAQRNAIEYLARKKLKRQMKRDYWLLAFLVVWCAVVGVLIVFI